MGTTNLLPPPNNLRIRQQALPRNRLHARLDLPLRQPGSSSHVSLAPKEVTCPSREPLPLLDQVVPDQSEGALGQDRRADVQVSGIAGAGGERRGSEAVARNVLVGDAENGFLDGREGGGRGRVVVGVVGAALLVLLLLRELLYLGASTAAVSACAVGAGGAGAGV